MNLNFLFESLATPKTNEDGLQYSAQIIPGFPYARIARDTEGNPSILFDVEGTLETQLPPNTRLKNLHFYRNLKCTIEESGKSRKRNLTVIGFTAEEKELQDHFLFVSQSFLDVLGKTPTRDAIATNLLRFIRVFQLLSSPAKKPVQGLWAELFLIESSRVPEVLLRYWHCSPNAIFDFSSNIENIEVKSTSMFERRHTFSHEQLSASNSRTYVASVFAELHLTGLNVFDLVRKICDRVEDRRLVERLHAMVFATLGQALEDANGFRYNYVVAGNSLLFFDSNDIPRIDQKDVPDGIVALKYTSDLTNIPSYLPQDISARGVRRIAGARPGPSRRRRRPRSSRLFRSYVAR